MGLQALYVSLLHGPKIEHESQQNVQFTEGDYNESPSSRRVWWLSATAAAGVYLIAALPVHAEPLSPEQLIALLEQWDENLNPQNWLERNEHLLGPLAILCSAAISLLLARQAINANRAIAQKRATFDYMSHLRWDKDFIDASQTYLECRRGSTRMAHLAEEYEKIDPNNGDLTSEQQEIMKKHGHIKRLLNEYEAIAVGINTQALCEEVVVRNYKQAIVSTVDECNDFIEKTREYAGKKGYSKPDKIYKEIQDKVAAWKHRS